MAKIVCVGLACLDYLFKIETLPKGGGKFFATDYAAAPGGPAAAASLAVAALGHEAIFLGRLGGDEIGDTIVAQMKKRGVNTDFIRRIENRSSQVSSVVVERSGERQIVNFSSSQLDPDPSWLPRDVVARTDVLLVDVRWPQGAEKALKTALKHDIPSLIDADTSPVDISGLVKLATHAVFSETGLKTVSGQADIKEGLETARDKTRGFVAVTAGDKGCYWLEDNRVRHCPADPIEAEDTCGAGDVFHGAFAVGMAEQMTMEQIIRFAGKTATLKCLTFGGSSGVPDRKTVDAALKNETKSQIPE